MCTGREADIKEGILEKVTFILSPKDDKSSKSRLQKKRGHVFPLLTRHRVEESATFFIKFFLNLI